MKEILRLLMNGMAKFFYYYSQLNGLGHLIDLITRLYRGDKWIG